MSYYIQSPTPAIFIQIPKTAGRSVLTLINENYKYETITNNKTLNNNYHSTLADVDSFICPLVPPYVFTIVRNPWCRVASWFFFRQEVLRQGLKALFAGKKTNKVQDNVYSIRRNNKNFLESMN